MNVAELLKSIGNLLDGAGQAFITSIVGLFISFSSAPGFRAASIMF